MASIISRLAVCSWSLQPKSPAELIAQLEEIGLRRVQLALDPLRADLSWKEAPEQLRNAGIEVVSGMLTTVGEDYSTMESIRRTGGLVPEETWQDNWENIQTIAEIAENLELNLVTFHAGFLPDDPGEPAYEKMLHRLRLVADVFAAKKIEIGFETGQETAAALREFLKRLGRVNVGVNFDPANIILYDNEDPVDALKILAPCLKQCHIKDATRTKKRGTWGEEVVTGTGEVPWEKFFQTLSKEKFAGHLCMEREAGVTRVADIKAALKFIEKLPL